MSDRLYDVLRHRIRKQAQRMGICIKPNSPSDEHGQPVPVGYEKGDRGNGAAAPTGTGPHQN